MVRCEDLFTLEELRRAGGRPKAHTATGVDGVLNEFLRGDRGVPRDPSGSLQLLSLEEASSY